MAVLPPAFLSSSQQMEEVEGREERETSNLNDGVDSNVDDQAIERISRSLRIEKDQEVDYNYFINCSLKILL